MQVVHCRHEVVRIRVEKDEEGIIEDATVGNRVLILLEFPEKPVKCLQNNPPEGWRDRFISMGKDREMLQRALSLTSWQCLCSSPAFIA